METRPTARHRRWYVHRCRNCDGVFASPLPFQHRCPRCLQALDVHGGAPIVVRVQQCAPHHGTGREPIEGRKFLTFGWQVYTVRQSGSE